MQNIPCAFMCWLILYKRQGAEATKSMRAQAGRASYVAADKVGGVTFVWVKFRITGLLKVT